MNTNFKLVIQSQVDFCLTSAAEDKGELICKVIKVLLLDLNIEYMSRVIIDEEKD